jgi:hypothetical protein
MELPVGILKRSTVNVGRKCLQTHVPGLGAPHVHLLTVPLHTLKEVAQYSTYSFVCF